VSLILQLMIPLAVFLAFVLVMLENSVMFSLSSVKVLIGGLKREKPKREKGNEMGTKWDRLRTKERGMV
jgi:hypothetical protein